MHKAASFEAAVCPCPVVDVQQLGPCCKEEGATAQKGQGQQALPAPPHLLACVLPQPLFSILVVDVPLLCVT